MIAWNIILLIFALWGHVSLWVAVFNRVHAFPFSPKTLKWLERTLPLLTAITPLGLIPLYPHGPAGVLARLPTTFAHGFALCYLVLCLASLCRVVSLGLLQRIATGRQLNCLLSNDTTRLEVEQQLGFRPLGKQGRIRILGRLPGNEILDVHVHEKVLRVPSLPDALDGLTITHLSDLHYTGALTPPFFDCVIDRAIEFDSDLVVLTGDIVDKDPCIDWIQGTLGRLRGRYGTWFILGNHDKRLKDVPHLISAMQEAGWVHVGGRSLCADVRQSQVLIAGNELPWFGPAPAIDPTMATCAEGGLFRILLSHSPDPLPDARREQFDLMLAGHTHGGQICLPWGPMICPSRFGVRYASGLFYEPPTLMHVTRGISGLHPIRYNCPPELAQLKLIKP